MTTVDEKLTANDDDKSLIDFDKILPVKECTQSDLLKFADKKYAEMYWKEIEAAEGLAICADVDHPNYANAGWKNHR